MFDQIIYNTISHTVMTVALREGKPKLSTCYITAYSQESPKLYDTDPANSTMSWKPVFIKYISLQFTVPEVWIGGRLQFLTQDHVTTGTHCFSLTIMRVTESVVTNTAK